ncbi:MAG: YicC family protein [Oscillospiraceae bacterium]|jgi:uncharacterized protein (TIGR00255 family)|nr:YicC family protein [Oscillospiraceae bacterium]
MIKSMTGWGDARADASGSEIRVELKSVNNRHLDCSVRLPRAYLKSEEAIKTAVSSRVSRGKVDVFVNIDNSKSSAAMPTVNLELAKAYAAAHTAVSDALGLHGELRAADILRFPDVMSIPREDDNADDVSAAILTALDAALTMFDDSRAREGERLRADINARLDAIESLVAIVEEQSPQTVAEYRRKLEQRMSEILADTTIDESRILTEAAIFADRVAVDEETVRLRSHLAEFRGTLRREEPIGRRLDFLVQECNREANTIGSKCSDAELARVVVDIKAEIEKVREQAANVE